METSYVPTDALPRLYSPRSGTEASSSATTALKLASAVGTGTAVSLAIPPNFFRGWGTTNTTSGSAETMQKLDYHMERLVRDTDEYKARYGAYVLGPDQNFAVMTNGTGIHALPIFVQELYNSAAAKITGVTGRRVAFVHPLPLTQVERSNQLNQQTFILGMGIVISFAFVSCFSLVFIVDEREMEIKTQQYINGVRIQVGRGQGNGHL